jgi:poly(3-hydroxybutyrate) depolymerase
LRFASLTAPAAFISRVLDYMSENYCVDVLRVHALGLSNGAEMAWRLACQLSARVASVAVVAGALANSLLGGCLVACARGDALHVMCYNAAVSPSCAAPHQPPMPLRFACTSQARV